MGVNHLEGSRQPARYDMLIAYVLITQSIDKKTREASWHAETIVLTAALPGEETMGQLHP